jgi:hypothetical protein
VNPNGGHVRPTFAHYCAAQLPRLTAIGAKPGAVPVKLLDSPRKMQSRSAFLRLQQKPGFPILLQRGIAGLPAKPPPFLGVSSLNLAASSEAAFFPSGAGPLCREFVALILAALG